jgi:hypothetical protein
MLNEFKEFAMRWGQRVNMGTDRRAKPDRGGIN